MRNDHSKAAYALVRLTANDAGVAGQRLGTRTIKEGQRAHYYLGTYPTAIPCIYTAQHSLQQLIYLAQAHANCIYY